MNLNSIKNFLYTYLYYNPYISITVKIHDLKKKFQKISKKKGVNLIGFPKGDFGLGEHIRFVASSFTYTQIPFCVNNTDLASENPNDNKSIDKFISNNNEYNVNIFCFNGPHVVKFKTKRKNQLTDNQYNIGYGYWELSEFPREFRKQFKYLDEVWAPSKYIYEILRRTTKKPIFHMPIPVDFPIPTKYTRKDFNLPENKFLFLFSFDMSSVTKRKNPEAIIKCFKKAFNKEDFENVGLVIKLQRIKGKKIYDDAFEDLMKNIDKPNIYLIDEVYKRDKILGLVKNCDVYISLHRSEGFGLGLAEAMKMGRNTLATKYSGNLDFMNEKNSCLIPFKLIKVKKNEYPYYKKGSVWAEPDLNEAIKLMKKLYENKEYREILRKNGKEYMDKYHSFEYIAQNYQKQIDRIFNTMEE